MKKFLVPVLVIIILAMGAYIVLHSSSKTTVTTVPKDEATTTPAKTALTTDKSLNTEKTYTAPDQYTTFKVTYPQFTNVSADFNKKISDQVETAIAQQKKDAADNWKARYDTRVPGDKITQFPSGTDKFYFDVSWKPIQENDKYISVTLTTSAYEGGAHGYETISSFNYDVKNQKEVALKDLFPNDTNYLKTISDFVRKNLTAEFRTRLNIKTKDDEANFTQVVLPMMQEGTTPTAENFSVFTFTDSAINFYFNQYQVAPYSMGSSTVTMPRK